MLPRAVMPGALRPSAVICQPPPRWATERLRPSAHQHAGGGFCAAEVKAGEFLTRPGDKEAAKCPLHVAELVAGKRIDHEDQVRRPLRHAAQINLDHLVVALTLAGQVVAGVLDRLIAAAQAHKKYRFQVLELIVEQQTPGVEIDAPAAGRVPPQAHADAAEFGRAVFFAQRDPFAFFQAQGLGQADHLDEVGLGGAAAGYWGRRGRWRRRPGSGRGKRRRFHLAAEQSDQVGQPAREPLTDGGDPPLAPVAVKFQQHGSLLALKGGQRLEGQARDLGPQHARAFERPLVVAGGQHQALDVAEPGQVNAELRSEVTEAPRRAAAGQGRVVVKDDALVTGHLALTAQREEAQVEARQVVLDAEFQLGEGQGALFAGLQSVHGVQCKESCRPAAALETGSGRPRGDFPKQVTFPECCHVRIVVLLEPSQGFRAFLEVL